MLAQRYVLSFDGCGFHEKLGLLINKCNRYNKKWGLNVTLCLYYSCCYWFEYRTLLMKNPNPGVQGVSLQNFGYLPQLYKGFCNDD